MIFDSHIHTEFSTDATMLLTDALERSFLLGIGVTVTEHMDLYYPEPGKFRFAPTAYFEKYHKLRSRDCLLGIEIGMLPGCAEEYRKIIAAHPFDYVVGSVHTVEGKKLWEADCFAGRTKIAAYRSYLYAVKQCVEQYPFIDSLGHLDYITRYAPYADKTLYYHAFAPEIDAILRELIAGDSILEVNTRQFHDDRLFAELLKIYRRYEELGGKYLTVGSDAHLPDCIGYCFDRLNEIEKACHLSFLYFSGREKKRMIE